MKIERQKYEVTFHTRWFSVTLSRTRQKRIELQEAGLWRTGGGQLVHVSRMSDRHLMNTIRFLLRKAAKEAKRLHLFNADHHTFPVEAYPPPRGEMAQDLYWQMSDDYGREDAVGDTIERFLRGQPVFQLMVEETERRGLEDRLWS